MKSATMRHLLIGCAINVCCFMSRGFAADTLYVSTAGNDAWSGRLDTPNVARTDGPLASLIGARDKLRQLRAQAAAEDPTTVRILGGVYRTSEPLVLTPEDSGTETAPVRFEVAPQQRAVLSGGQVIVGLAQRGPLWEVTIPEVKNGQWYFCQLFVNGQRRQRARSPNTGYYRVAERLPGPPDAQGQPFARDKFVFAPGDLTPFERIHDVNLVLMHSWETSIHPLQSVDVDARTVQFAEPLKEWWCIGYWEPQQRYYVENARESLDQPGEWYLNRETGVLSYWPLPGETLAAAEIVAPRATELVRFAGRPDEGRCVEHVTLRGLTLHHSDWVPDPRSNSSTQAAVEVPAAVMADGARHCTIEDCEVAHVGNYGLWLRRGCSDCQVRRNRLFDLGAGGIRVGEANMAPTDAAESSRNLIDNNHIFDGGNVYAAGIGVWVAQSSHNRISNNDIHDLDYTGISIGWNWDDLTQGELLIPLGERSLDERLAGGEPLGEWNRNLYWHAQGSARLRFYRRDFAQWQALGLDRDSLIADPKFVDPERRDFQLTADSPAFALDFHPLNIQQVGLYGDPAWVAEANHAHCAVVPLPSLPPP